MGELRAVPLLAKYYFIALIVYISKMSNLAVACLGSYGKEHFSPPEHKKSDSKYLEVAVLCWLCFLWTNRHSFLCQDGKLRLMGLRY